MKILTYGEIMDGGASVFHSVAKVDGEWFKYQRENGRLVLKLDEKKQD